MRECEGSQHSLICISQRKTDQDLPTHADDPHMGQRIKNSAMEEKWKP